MAARKNVTKGRTTKKSARTGVASARPKTKVKSKGKPKANAKPKATAKAKPKTTAKAKPKATAKAKPKATAKAKPKATAKAKPKTAAKPKTTAKAKAPPRAKSTRPAKPKPSAGIVRRDPTGHLNPRYAAELRARSGSARGDQDDSAFLQRAYTDDTLAEELGEEAVITMTTGEDQSSRMQDLEIEEESGGPFITTTGREEFAHGTDTSNPFDGTREPFPTT